MIKTKPIQFDNNGIYASDNKLSQIALECLQQERDELALRRATRNIEFTTFNITDRH